MDGGRRVLGSLSEPLSALAAAAHPRPLRPAVLSSSAAPAQWRARPPAAPLSSPRRPGRLARLAAFAARPGVGLCATAALFGAVALAGFAQNGGYQAFLAQNGAPRDILARALGFSIRAVTITGLAELREGEVLAASGVGPGNSLLFFDAEAARERLAALPLVESVRVLKLFPDRLVIALEERRPFALWQRDGVLQVVSADGMVVDEARDERFIGLPFIVGEGAQKKLADYMRLLEAAGELRPRVKAGVRVSDRRWSLMLTNGVEVKLPEREPEAALALLRKLQREARILDKDVLSVDLREAGRVVARLSEEAAAARAATAKGARKAGPT